MRWAGLGCLSTPSFVFPSILLLCFVARGVPDRRAQDFTLKRRSLKIEREGVPSQVDGVAVISLVQGLELESVFFSALSSSSMSRALPTSLRRIASFHKPQGTTAGFGGVILCSMHLSQVFG